MSPSHASKATKRYRYYVSQAGGAAPVWRVPGGDLEELVLARLGTWLCDSGSLHDIASDQDAVVVDALLFAGEQLAGQLGEVLPHERAQRCSR